ncbi:MAG TPA: hypothetical protein VJL80_13615 [Aeromicrobium sp.]|nr:hypothetical protein [Aeromicrobium sp.]HKY59072.1 hypothetical protein [Aeromicrobium sp.]
MKARRPSRTHVTLSWGLGDQIVASGSNFVFIVIAAKTLPAADFGAIAIVLELCLLSAFIARGITGDPLTSRFAGASDAELKHPLRSAATATVVIGILVGAGLAVAALLTEGPLRSVLLVAAVATPGLTLQDFVRSALIVQGRVKSTFVNDLLWAVIQLPALGAAILLDAGAATVFAAWAATGCLTALVGMFQLKCRFGSLRTVPAWLRETRELWPYYLADNLVYQLTSLLLVLVISTTSGLVAVAGFRVAMTVYAPLSTIGRGVISVAVAMLARRRNDPPGVRSRAMLISAALTPMAIGWGLLMLLVPDSLGEAAFGSSWQPAEPLLFLAGFVSAAGLFGSGAVAGLRGLGAGRHTLAGRAAVSIGASVAAAAGGYIDGVHGVFVALAWIFPIQAAVWWWLLRDATHRAEEKLRSGESLDIE